MSDGDCRARTGTATGPAPLSFGRRPPVIGETGVVALRERTSELDAIAKLLDTGGLLVVEGPAGIGKTALLGAAAERAAAQGRRVRVARGTQLERTYAY